MIMISGLLIFALLGLIAVASFAAISAMLARFGGWARSYHRLGKRYGARVFVSLGKPRMTFNYGPSYCVLKSRFSRFRKHRKSQLSIKWEDRKLKLFISSFGHPVGIRKSWKLQPIDVADQFGGDEFVVYCNQVELARQMLTPVTRWQIRQLAQHHGNTGVEVFIHQGQMRVSKPGYIKDYQQLDDFVRFALDLFDQLKLAYNEDIQFVSEDDAVVLSDVKCPICSERIQDQMVVCVRCKTPHCGDCWEYNGQCATFACQETRYFLAGGSQSAKA